MKTEAIPGMPVEMRQVSEIEFHAYDSEGNQIQEGNILRYTPVGDERWKVGHIELTSYPLDEALVLAQQKAEEYLAERHEQGQRHLQEAKRKKTS